MEVAPFSFELRPNDLGVEVWLLDEFLGTYRDDDPKEESWK
jgi:hypothetical protein